MSEKQYTFANHMVPVLESHGKGSAAPHQFRVRLFRTEADAQNFIKQVNDTEGKYWTLAKIVTDVELVEPTREGYFTIEPSIEY